MNHKDRLGSAAALLLVLAPSRAFADMGGMTDGIWGAVVMMAGLLATVFAVLHLTYGAAAWTVARRWRLGQPVPLWLAIPTGLLFFVNGSAFVTYGGLSLWLLVAALFGAGNEALSPTTRVGWVPGPDGTMVETQIPNSAGDTLSTIGIWLLLILVGVIAFGVPTYLLWRGWRQRVVGVRATEAGPPDASTTDEIAAPGVTDAQTQSRAG